MANTLVGARERPTTVTILVDRELRTRLERVAAENERSLGAEVRHMLRRHLSDNEEGKT
jgi:plasmid stability protein